MNCLDCAIKDKKIAELTASNRRLMFDEFKYLTELEMLSEHPYSKGAKQIREKYIRKIELRRQNLGEN